MIQLRDKRSILFINDDMPGYSVIVNHKFHGGMMVLEVRDVQTC
jgi:hypothetical protein